MSRAPHAQAVREQDVVWSTSPVRMDEAALDEVFDADHECCWSLWLPSLAEYGRWLREAGFARVEFLDGQGGPAGRTRRRLLFLTHTTGARAQPGSQSAGSADRAGRDVPVAGIACRLRVSTSGAASPW